MTWWNAILPVVTLILGYFGTLWTEERRDARALARAQTERAALASAARADRRENFELETLTRAHTALGDFGRAVGRAHHVDSMIAKETGVYASTLLPEEDSQRLHTTGRAVRDIGGLILDDDIRDALDVAHTKGNFVSGMHRADPIKAEAVFVEAVTAIDAAQKRISARIREIYKAR